MKIHQKTQTAWECEYLNGMHTPRDLYDAGFRPRSNRYRMAIKEWRYYKQFYSITLTLTPDDYKEFKSCEHDVWMEEIEKKEIAEYKRFLYLQNKYGAI